jgi:hypothetical protein
MVKVSEIEKLTGTSRIRNVDQPVTSVKPTRTNQDHSTGCRINSRIETTNTATPAVTTVP